MSLLDNMPHLATAKRRKMTKDTMGGVKESFPTTVFSDRACWRQPASDREVSLWKKQSQEVTHKVYFAEDPVVDEGCILVIDDVNMDVVSVSDPDASAGLGKCWRVFCRKWSV